MDIPRFVVSCGFYARGGLVQQQEGRLRREGAGELDFALVAIRKARHQVVGAVPQAQNLQHLQRPGAN